MPEAQLARDQLWKNAPFMGSRDQIMPPWIKAAVDRTLP
jgi:hypothetical protein